jgi:hypothetical protein
MNSSDEYVMESFVTFDKMKTLIYDLLMTEVWKEELYPLLKKELNEVNSIRSYMAMYHEASVCNLLEVFLYNRTACESADDVLVELIDYAYRKFARLVNKCDHLSDG